MSLDDAETPVPRDAIPTDKELVLFLQSTEHANLGIAKLLAVIKDKNPTWALSLTRLRHFRQSLSEEVESKWPEVSAKAWINCGDSINWRCIKFQIKLDIPPVIEQKLLKGLPITSNELERITRKLFLERMDGGNGKSMEYYVLRNATAFPEFDTGDPTTSGLPCGSCYRQGIKKRAKAQLWFLRLITKKLKGKAKDKSQLDFVNLEDALVDLQIYVQPMCGYGSVCEIGVREPLASPAYHLKDQTSAQNIVFCNYRGIKLYTEEQITQFWYDTHGGGRPASWNPLPSIIS